jgi:hypothetical protein
MERNLDDMKAGTWAGSKRLRSIRSSFGSELRREEEE